MIQLMRLQKKWDIRIPDISVNYLKRTSGLSHRSTEKYMAEYKGEAFEKYCNHDTLSPE